MQDKLTAYVRNLFRNAADTQRNRELEEEILQNTLDRYEDLMNSGLTPEDAYHQAIANLGDVESLFEKAAFTPRREEKGSSRAAWIAVAVVLAVILLIFGGAALLIGLNYAGPDPLERAEHKVEAEVEHMETAVEQLVDGVEDAAVGLVEDDVDHGLAGFAYHYKDEERFSIGSADVETRNVNRLVIDWVAGSVTVEPYDGDTISIWEPEQNKDKNRLRWQQQNDTLTIRYCASTGSGEVGAKDLTVRIPVELADNLRYVQIDTVSADAVVSKLQAGELQFDSTSGNLRADGYYGIVDVDTTSGGMEFAGAADEVELDTASGDYRLYFAERPRELSFDSASGDLTLVLPEERNLRVEFDTVSGNFINEYGEFRKRDGELFFEGAGSETELEIDTVSGDLRMEKIG